MTTRRDFLRGGAAAATGIVFCGCGLLHRAHAQQPARQTLPVTVAGKRIKTIDVHSHCHFHEAGALLGADAAKLQLPPVNGAAEAFIEIEKRLAAMDAQAVDMEVLSINPFWYDRERDLAAQIVKLQNEKLAELCATKPDRFAAFASLTLQAPDPDSTPSGPRRKNSACPCSFIRKACRSLESASPATAGSPTRSAILWGQQWRSRT